MVAVLDGAEIGLFRITSHEDAPKLTAQPNPVFERDNHGSGAGHHGSSAHPDHGPLEEDSHAAGVAALLDKAAAIGDMAHLVMVASPRSLCKLRKHFGRPLSEVVDREIAKDLTGHSIENIEKAVVAG